MNVALTKVATPADDLAMERDEGGFTLIELMVVVLIIAILLAIAIPSFLGARQRANDRAAQSNLHNALTNELVVYSDNAGFNADPAFLASVDASLQYTIDRPTMIATKKMVYVEVRTASSTNDTVILGSKSATGDCFWIRNVGDTNLPRFAENDCSAVPAAFLDEW